MAGSVQRVEPPAIPGDRIAMPKNFIWPKRHIDPFAPADKTLTSQSFHHRSPSGFGGSKPQNRRACGLRKASRQR